MTTDCGLGREGLSRRIAYHKCVALVQSTNIVRRELSCPKRNSAPPNPSSISLALARSDKTAVFDRIVRPRR